MKTSRYVFFAGAIAAVLLVALIAGLAMRSGDRGAAVPSVSPAPSGTATPGGSAVPTGATTTPSASPSGSAAILDDRFGFLVTTGVAKTSLRSETGGPPIGVKPGFRADFDGIGFAANGSGTSIAYWHTAAGGGLPQELRIIRVGEDQEQTLMTLPPSQVGGGIVWSDDQSGLLYEVHSVESVGGAGGGPKTSSLESFDLRASQAQGRAHGMLTNGRVYEPIAWSRSAGLVAAGETGEGGFMSAYVTFTTATLPAGQSPQTRIAVSDRVVMGTVTASSNARFVLGALVDSGAIRWWPLADYAAGKVVATSIGSAAWQPATTRFAYVAGDDLVLYDVTTASATSVAGGLRGKSVRTFRPDGSAVFLFGAPPPTIVELATGRSAALEARGGIGPWVRFGP